MELVEKCFGERLELHQLVGLLPLDSGMSIGEILQGLVRERY